VSTLAREIVLESPSIDGLVYRVYKGIVNQTAERGYRLDLRQEAIARASAIRLSQETKKDLPEKKVRGAKAKEASRKKS
jgi:large subunit ribosomal protein L28e